MAKSKLMTMERDLSSVRINFEAQNIYHLQWSKWQWSYCSFSNNLL